MSWAVSYPAVLLALALVLIPFFFHGQRTRVYSSLAMIPSDPLSSCTAWALRGVAALAIAATVAGLSGLHRPEQVVERIGRGAQIVLLLDRSTSMDDAFAGRPNRMQPLSVSRGASKGEVARQQLTNFIARRRGDMFSMLVFSTFPIQVIPFTQKQPIIQATIDAGGFGRGLAETNIAAGLKAALEVFEERPYTGSRVVILLSDGAGEVDRPSRRRIERLLREHRVVLYWIYIRSRNSPKILDDSEDTVTRGLSPERSLYRFFSAMDVPFRAYTAESPQELERAIADVGRLQNLPNRYDDVVPKTDLSPYCYALSLVLTLLLAVARVAEVKTWPRP